MVIDSGQPGNIWPIAGLSSASLKLRCDFVVRLETKLQASTKGAKTNKQARSRPRIAFQTLASLLQDYKFNTNMLKSVNKQIRT
ncbi:hypothetical protein [Arcticibacter svalbardensis]|uniref:hypothetical protein n=1 Tax=Arcticibacter svalbardensis TaxID=1288027 RepID=UPI0005908016|nr:hypothetical protein [Arcticibacter svalbardensis]